MVRGVNKMIKIEQSFQFSKRDQLPDEDVADYARGLSELAEPCAYGVNKMTKIEQRFHFSKRDQLPDEDVADYARGLRELAEPCAYDSFLDDALTQRFVTGLNDDEIRNELLQKTTLNFEMAVEIAMNLTAAHNTSENLTIIEINTIEDDPEPEPLPVAVHSKLAPWWVHGVQAADQAYFGYCSTVEDAVKVLRSFEEATSSKFVVLKKEKYFGDLDINAGNHQVRFEGMASKTNVPTVPYLGMPFIALASRVYECQYGIDRHFEQKREKKLKNELLKKSRSSLQPSFKRNCPAKVTMREIVVFPEYRITRNVLYQKKHASKRVRTALKSNKPIAVEQRIYVALPPRQHHENHFTDDYDY